MPDIPFGSEQLDASSDKGHESECNTICVDVERIYDSCGAKDCLSDLPLMFTKESQCLIENACSAKINCANVITSTVKVEPVPFHRGFYAVDMVFYFIVSVDVYTAACAIPTTVTGLATYGKRVVLYGGDGCVKSFSSLNPVTCDPSEMPDKGCCYPCSLPEAKVQISDPMPLSSCIKHHRPPKHQNCTTIPECVLQYLGGEIACPSDTQILVTLGIFTITRLQRNVQVMIPSYDFCVPRKECKNQTDDPCEAFSKIEFPTDSFFPSKTGDCDKSHSPFDCCCRE